MKFYRTHVLVSVDPDCVRLGAREILDALQDELADQGLLDEVKVMETSRIGDLSEAPDLMVYPDNVHYVGLTADDIPYIVQVVIGDQPKVTYGKVNSDVARRIMKEHVEAGHVVQDHVIPV